MALPEDTILEKRYRIDALLAHSAGGAVYRAFDTNINVPVTIKEIYLQSPQHIAQFKQEALALGRLRHPHLPRVTHHFSFEGRQYLVMDFIEGENLWQLVEQHGKPLPEEQALTAIIQVCRAVSYLHEQNPPIFHHDIKPANIIITPEEQAILVDFGIARQISNEESYAQAGAGTVPAFSSPEQYSGDDIGLASDIYALGATLYALVTGQIPPNSVSRVAENAKLLSPEVINPELSAQAAQAINYAMHLKPESRPESVAQWQQILEGLHKAEPDSLASPLVEQAVPAQPQSSQADTVPHIPPLPVQPATAFWLVDSTGLGYPLGPAPLTIGSQAYADVVVADSAVSAHHASIRVEGQRCLVLDEKSTLGTYLNGHRLQVEWYPLNPGDVLVIGPARFYLTTTQPARVAPPKPKVIPPATSTGAGASTAPQPVHTIPEPAASKTRPVWPIAAILILVLLALGAGLYVWFGPRRVTVLPAGASSPNQTATSQAQQAAQTQTAQAEANHQIEQAVALTIQAKDAKATRQAEAETNNQTQATVQVLQDSRTSTPETIPIPTNVITSISTTIAITATVSITPATVTPTRQIASPTPVEPTAIPLQSQVFIDRIGSQEVLDVEINPQNPQEVYALVKRDGIYKSSNGGDGPWARVDLDGSSITALALDPDNPATLYAPTWNAVLKTSDGGNTWDPKTEGLIANQVVESIAIHPLTPNVLYAGIGEKLVVSADSGENWTSQGYGENLGIGRIYAIAIDPFNNGTLYVGGLAAALYKSTDSGKSFTPIVNAGKGVFGIALHPGQQDILLVGINSGDAGILKSTNGIEFYPVSTGLLYGGADSAYSAIAYAPGNPAIVYAGSGYESNPDAKGIFKSTDGGETWESINNGLNINRDTGFPYYVKAIVVHPTNADIVFAATGSGLYQSTDGGRSWLLK